MQSPIDHRVISSRSCAGRHHPLKSLCLAGTCLLLATAARSAPVQVTVRTDQPVAAPVSKYLTGACIEDVNHEIYGGIYSQMIFGESFQEPAPPVVLDGFKTFGGTWQTGGDEVAFTGSAGDKLVSEAAGFGDGEIGVEILVSSKNWSNIGLLVRVANAGPGNDAFDGYEVALQPSAQALRLGRHRHNWEPIRDVPCELAVGQWVPVVVKLQGPVIEILVNGKSVLRHDDGRDALGAGTFGLRAFQNEGRWRNLWVRTNGVKHPVAFKTSAPPPMEVSRMWTPVVRGDAKGGGTLVKDGVFVGKQSQRLEFSSGSGEIGIANHGLNRWGMHFQQGKDYEGVVWARSAQPAELQVALENRDGTRSYAKQQLNIPAGDWQKLTFTLQPDATDTNGRFAVTLTAPGSVTLGYAFLQPGSWGRFKGLPVRRDVAEGLLDQGITVLRYGGSMINHAEYRWKNMIGPRDRRPPCRGTWYEFSSNGWGIIDFVELCEAAGWLGIPAFNMNETPQDMADFVEYVNGPASSPWGAKRAAAGHSEPYQLTHIQLGNEERVDDAYFEKFRNLALAIWAKDPRITLVVGDFAYFERITDPFNFRGAYSGLTTLAAQQKILRLAKDNGREVWFDLHVGTEGPRPDGSLAGMFSFRDALERLADGARFRVVVFEFNAGNHTQRRALANALAINAIRRDGGIPVATSANCLQPDGQNDNGWNQGLLFLNPYQVWLQPPGYVTRMISRNYQPRMLPVQLDNPGQGLDVCATASADGRTLVLHVVNVGEQPVPAVLHLLEYNSSKPTVTVEELAGPLASANTAAEPLRIKPVAKVLHPELSNNELPFTFAPNSFTVLRVE